MSSKTKSIYAVKEQHKKAVKESNSFKNTFSEIFKLCRSIEKKYNKYGAIDPKDSTELTNLNLYEDIWDHPENDVNTHRIWLKEIFIANKKSITKNNNKDAWLRDSSKQNVIIYGGESNKSKPYKIDLCYFYKRACIISARVKREEDEENEEFGFDEIRLPMRNSNIKFRYWLYRCFVFIADNEKDQKSIKKQLALIRSSLGIGVAKGGSSFKNIMNMAKDTIGQSNLSNISKNVYKNLKDMKVDGSDPDKIGDVISQTVKSPGFKKMVSTMTTNAKDAKIVTEMEDIAKDFCPEVTEMIAKEEEAEKTKKDSETEKLEDETKKLKDDEIERTHSPKSDDKRMEDDTNEQDETKKLKDDEIERTHSLKPDDKRVEDDTNEQDETKKLKDDEIERTHSLKPDDKRVEQSNSDKL
uniref:Uncharacterized protein n=1 Tax=Pithovirus LCPAC406 TaxID=2506599 RepID=A0A481ZD25_9VIRU|nr:MAG: hypothetical protein LCPAC406_01220 [Pithovirus LCPAC406]